MTKLEIARQLLEERLSYTDGIEITEAFQGLNIYGKHECFYYSEEVLIVARATGLGFFIGYDKAANKCYARIYEVV